MKKILIAIIIIAAIWFLHRENPTFNEHKTAISKGGRVAEARWDDLEFKNYLLLSFTQSHSRRSMVSFGICTYVRVLDDEWLDFNI